FLALVGREYPVTAAGSKRAVRVALAVAPGVVGGAVVACLGACLRAVAALADTLRASTLGTTQGQLVLRRGAVSFGLETRDLVHTTVHEPEVAGRRTVERHRTTRGAMHAAEVDRQPVVDEHPDVVVATELELRIRPRRVREPVLELAREVEVPLGVGAV